MNSTKKSQLRPFTWFIIFNSLIAILISLRYFAYLPSVPTDLLGFTFLVSSTVSQMLLLAFVFGLITLPLLFVSQRAYLISSSLVATFAILLLLVDTFVFAQYRFHINTVVVELVLSGEVVEFSFLNHVLVVTLFTLVFAAEYFVLSSLFSRSFFKQTAISKKFSFLLLTTLLLTNGIHIWAAANPYKPVNIVKRYIPLFHPVTANSFMKKRGWIDLEAITEEKNRKIKIKGDLKYPLVPLKAHKPKALKDIVFIVVDSWRFDTFSKQVTPNIYSYSQRGTVLQKHYSTGNSTRTGIFGLFYGIPGTYWHSFLANQQSPVLVQRLQSLGYQMGIFSSAHLLRPEFNQTVFRDIKDLRVKTEGDSPSKRDKQLTDDWVNWYSQQNQQSPKFSFLFYDAAHGYDFPADYPEEFSPMVKEVDYLSLNNDYDATPFFNRYKNSVHYIDSLIANVFKTIESNSDFDNTVFIITGDHGQEMNDNKLNFWGHNSNFSDAQTKVPFIMITPDGKAPLSKTMMTSHQDVAPTLLKNYLGVDSKSSDYSLGIDILNNDTQRQWVFASSYNTYAIIDDKSILEVNSLGQYQQLDKTNRPSETIKINYKNLQQALSDMKYFID